MDDQADAQVMRTINLPLSVDRRLREVSFSRGVSKSDLMRDLIADGLARIEASGERTLAERVSARGAAEKD